MTDVLTVAKYMDFGIVCVWVEYDGTQIDLAHRLIKKLQPFISRGQAIDSFAQSNVLMSPKR